MVSGLAVCNLVAMFFLEINTPGTTIREWAGGGVKALSKFKSCAEKYGYNPWDSAEMLMHSAALPMNTFSGISCPHCTTQCQLHNLIIFYFSINTLKKQN